MSAPAMQSNPRRAHRAAATAARRRERFVADVLRSREHRANLLLAAEAREAEHPLGKLYAARGANPNRGKRHGAHAGATFEEILWARHLRKPSAVKSKTVQRHRAIRPRRVK